MKAPLPIERLADDSFEVIALRSPAQHLANAVGAGDDRSGVAGAAPDAIDGEVDPGDALDDVDDLLDRGAVAIAAVAYQGRPAAPEIGERRHVGVDQVGDLDVVAHAGSVSRRIVFAEYFEAPMSPQRGLHPALDQMRRVRRRLAQPPLRIGARDIEVAQRDVAEVVGPGGILEHPLDHQFRPSVGGDGSQRRLLADRFGGSLAVDSRGRGEDEIAHSALDRAFDQIARLGHIVEVIAERVGDRFRNDDLGRKMGDRLDLVLLDEPADQAAVAKIADRERRRFRNRPGEPGREVVDDDDLLAGVDQSQRHVTADIAGAAGNQNAHFAILRRSRVAT